MHYTLDNGSWKSPLLLIYALIAYMLYHHQFLVCLVRTALETAITREDGQEESFNLDYTRLYFIDDMNHRP